MIPVTIWMNMSSFYQEDLFGDLAGKVDLRVVYDHGLTEDRRQLDWAEPKAKYSACLSEPDLKMRHASSILGKPLTALLKYPYLALAVVATKAFN